LEAFIGLLVVLGLPMGVDRRLVLEHLVDDEVVFVRGILKHVEAVISRLGAGALVILPEDLEELLHASRPDPDVHKLNEHPSHPMILMMRDRPLGGACRSSQRRLRSYAL